MKLPSASKLPIARWCVWAWWSPDARFVYDRSDAADRGSLFHAGCAEHAKLPGERRTLAKILDDLISDAKARGGEFRVSPADFALVERWLVAWECDAAPMLAGTWQAEVTLAYDPAKDVGRELAGVHPRDAWRSLKKGELSGAADVLIFPDAESLKVVDWKTGRIDNVEPAEENRQMRFLALAACRAFGRKRATVVLAYVSEDGVQAETATLDEAELAKTAEELRGVFARIAAKEPPTAGSHCRWCPTRAACPKTNESITEVVPDAEIVGPFKVVADAKAITGPDHAAWLLAILRRFKMAADDVETALKTYADDAGGIKTPDGVWARREIKTERLTMTPEVEAILRKELPDALTVGVTKASIEAAARKCKLPIAKTRGEVIDKLRAAGAVSESVTVKYEERKSA